MGDAAPPSEVFLLELGAVTYRLSGLAGVTVMDVKWGEGCYQETFEKAEKLADVLVQTSEGVGVKTVAVISHMESPLGRFVVLIVII